MRTQHHTQSNTSKASFNPHHFAAKPARQGLPKFKVMKPYEGFHVGQVVYQYQGPTYGVDCPDEVSVTVAPNQAPFVGLPPDFLEQVAV